MFFRRDPFGGRLTQAIPIDLPQALPLPGLRAARQFPAISLLTILSPVQPARKGGATMVGKT